MHGRTTRPAIPTRPRQPGFEGEFRVGRNLLDHLPGDAAQRHLDPPIPHAAWLACRLADVDVEEATARRPLGQRAEEIRKALATITLRRHGALEGEVIPTRSLGLDGPVVGPLALLQAEIYTGWGSLQDDAEPQFDVHWHVAPQDLPYLPPPRRRTPWPRHWNPPHVEMAPRWTRRTRPARPASCRIHRDDHGYHAPADRGRQVISLR